MPYASSAGSGGGSPRSLAGSASGSAGGAGSCSAASTAGGGVEAGGGAVIESNFRRGVSESELRSIVELADARLVHCSAAAETVQARYAQRYLRGDRHPVHLDAHRTDALADDLASGRFEPLDLDVPIVEVATDDGYEPGLEEVLAFLTSEAGVAVRSVLVALS